ncbi:MAG TPA: deaminase [Micromonosporaceae bacterium]|nr:deaminase [Micromonosporaceae bacterium]
MSRVLVTNHLTLDGVMQAPGRADEDRRGGFEHGGWAQARNDEVMGRYMGERMAAGGGGGALLLGRRTYEDFASFWPHQSPDNPFTTVINNMPKLVASRTLTAPLEWNNSTLLEGDVAEAVAKLKAKPGKDMVVLGSGDLIQTLMKHDLVDEFLLLVHPLVLGSGRHLFVDGTPETSLRLVDSTITTTGVVIATYVPSGSA